MSKRRPKGPPFVQLHHWVMNSRAWQDLSPNARALYIELKRRYNGHNNGEIGLGVREAGEAMGVGRNIANRAFQELELHHFIFRARDASFNQKRLTIEWRLAEQPDSRTGHSATKEFLHWEPIVSPAGLTHGLPLKPTPRKKRNPVPRAGRPVPVRPGQHG